MVDDPGGAFRREVGYGLIEDVKLKSGQRNAHVVINAEQLRDPVQGWVDSQGSRDVYLAAVDAFERGQRIYYRIETHRKDDVGAEVKFDDLTKHQKVRDVREIVAVNGKGQAISGNEPTAQPAEQSSLPVSGNEPPKEPEQTPERAPEQPAAEQPPAEPTPRPPGPRIQEGKPWEANNSDNSLNLGSYAVQAAEAMVLLAHDLLIARWRAGDASGPPSQGQIKALARRLLTAADLAQASAREDGHADRMDNSHTRARSAVRAALEIHPVPFGATEVELKEWVDALAAYASDLLATVLALIDREVP